MNQNTQCGRLSDYKNKTKIEICFKEHKVEIVVCRQNFFDLKGLAA
jgi:hypothetical protein